jgi:RNA polymerase sigma factor (sigma-70 family)
MIGAAEFSDVYDDHVWSVYGFFGYRVGHREVAEDLTQVTFEKALRAWGRYDPSRTSPRTWLLAIARNVLIDYYRRDGSGREEPIAENAPAPAFGTEPGPEPVGVSPELELALATLGQRDREVIALRFGADLTGPEIAGLLDLSLANVQQIVSRSLRRLRSELEAQASDDRLRSARERPEPDEADSRDR